MNYLNILKTIQNEILTNLSTHAIRTQGNDKAILNGQSYEPSALDEFIDLFISIESAERRFLDSNRSAGREAIGFVRFNVFVKSGNNYRCAEIFNEIDTLLSEATISDLAVVRFDTLTSLGEGENENFTKYEMVKKINFSSIS